MGRKERSKMAMMGMMGSVPGRVKQVSSLEETAHELGRIKKAAGGSPGALKPATITETNTKTGKKKSITVEPTMAYGASTGAKRKRRVR